MKDNYDVLSNSPLESVFGEGLMVFENLYKTVDNQSTNLDSAFFLQVVNHHDNKKSDYHLFEDLILQNLNDAVDLYTVEKTLHPECKLVRNHTDP